LRGPGLPRRRCAFVALLIAALAVPAHAGEHEAFVTNQLANTIGVVDLAAMKQIAAIAVTGAPAGLAMSPRGDFAYVTAPDGKELIAIDAGKRAIAWRLSVGAGPLGIAVNPQTGIVYVANWYGDETWLSMRASAPLSRASRSDAHRRVLP
jgi:YVTN family beta-propeller protein